MPFSWLLRTMTFLNCCCIGVASVHTLLCRKKGSRYIWYVALATELRSQSWWRDRWDFNPQPTALNASRVAVCIFQMVPRPGHDPGTPRLWSWDQDLNLDLLIVECSANWAIPTESDALPIELSRHLSRHACCEFAVRFLYELLLVSFKLSSW